METNKVFNYRPDKSFQDLIPFNSITKLYDYGKTRWVTES